MFKKIGKIVIITALIFAIAGCAKGGDANKIAAKFNEDVKAGAFINIAVPQDNIKRLYKLGYIKDEDLEGRLDKIPFYIKYELSTKV